MFDNFIGLIQLILGFVFIIKGADLLIDGSTSIAKRLKVSNLAIGLTLVAFGTSAPELVVNLLASYQGHGEIVIGNIIGSNIANILLILGITSIIYPLSIDKNIVWKEIPLGLLAVLLVWAVISDNSSGIDGFSIISRWDGLVLVAAFLVYLYYVVFVAKNHNKFDGAIKKFTYKKSIFYVLLGILGLSFGGYWVVTGAVDIAATFNIPEAVIGLTLVALGTSLPELVTSIVAALKKESDIAIGNIVGSNIFNLLWVLGLSAMVNPIIFSSDHYIDYIVMTMATILLFLMFFIGKKRTIDRLEGALLLVCYTVYITAVVLG